jgi:replicative DNA helicase
MTPEEAVKYEGPDRVVHFTDYLLSKTRLSSNKSFKSGFTKFEEHMGGIETGEVVVITGHRKEGKTLFAESWLRGMMKVTPETRPMILSYEVQPEKLLAKYVNDETLPIYLPLTLEAMNFDWLLRKCQEAKYKYNCRLVMIDHLHFMIDMALQQNMSLNIGGFMRSLKHQIAIGLNMGIVLLAHQGQPKEGREASVDTIRDSSFISQEADAVVVVSRRENLDQVELRDVQNSMGDEQANILRPPEGALMEDKYSAGLAIIKIDCHRRMGTYRWKKLFQKRGEWLTEV